LCKTIVLNAHEPAEEKSDDTKDSFYEELEQFFNNFPKCYTKIMLGDFNAKLGREDIFKPTTGNDILLRDCNDSS
jgi:exonuclease III